MAEDFELLASKSDDPEEEQEDDEEEALSLCDLPLNEGNKCCKEILEATQMRGNEEEFNFGSKESEMCAADEVFFKGQILPLRLSVSSESGLSRFQQESRNTSRCLSRSESMDHGSSSAGSTSINSSRSSSTRSYYSSTTTTTTTTSLNSTQKTRNNFHSCPSPNPQIRVSSFRLSNASNSSSSSSRSQKSTIWDLFRIGLVRTPEIELQDLKLRNNNINRSGCVSRNSSSGSSSNNSSGSQKDPSLEKKQTKKQNNIFEKRIGLFNLSSCKCSINAVETIPLNNTNSHNSFVVIKSSVGSSEELKIKKKKKKKKRTKKEEKKQEGKQAMSRHRTFEWLKDLSHGSYVVVDDDDDDHQ